MAQAPEGTEATRGRLWLLRSHRDFRLLFVAASGSAFGTYLAALALTAQIWDLTGSGKWVAALLVADFLPIVVLGLTLGPLVDRLSRRRLMIGADLVRVGVFAALPFVSTPAAIVALAGIAGIATGFFRPAVYAGLPNLVEDEDDLVVANSVLYWADNMAWMVGPVLAGVLLTVVGPEVPYALNAVSFLVSALLLSRIAAASLQSERSLTRGHWRDVKEGLSFVVTTPQLRLVLVVWSTVLMGNATINVAEVAFAKEVLDAGDVGFGIIVGATGLGLAAGAFAAPWATATIGMRRAYCVSIALMALGWGLAGAIGTSLAAVVALAIVATFGNAIAIVCNQLFVQRGAPDRLRGRSIAVLMSVTYAFLGLGMLVTGPLLDAIGARAVWTIGGCVYAVAAVTAVVLIRGLHAPGTEPALGEPEPEQAPAA